jgi:hypothetical protein
MRLCIVYLTLSIFLFIACKKENTTPTPAAETKPFTSKIDLERLAFVPDSFLCTATKNVPGVGNLAWTANCDAYIVDDKYGKRLQLRFMTYEDSKSYYTRETVGISGLPFKNGLSKVLSSEGVLDPNLIIFSGYARLLADGDVLDAYWRIDNSQNNYVNITNIDTLNKRVQGSFDVHFKQTTQGKENLHSTFINFKSGKFDSRISKY